MGEVESGRRKYRGRRWSPPAGEMASAPSPLGGPRNDRHPAPRRGAGFRWRPWLRCVAPLAALGAGSSGPSAPGQHPPRSLAGETRGHGPPFPIGKGDRGLGRKRQTDTGDVPPAGEIASAPSLRSGCLAMRGNPAPRRGAGVPMASLATMRGPFGAVSSRTTPTAFTRRRDWRTRSPLPNREGGQGVR